MQRSCHQLLFKVRDVSFSFKWKPLQEAKRRALALETVDQVEMRERDLLVCFIEARKRFTVLEFWGICPWIGCHF